MCLSILPLDVVVPNVNTLNRINQIDSPELATAQKQKAISPIAYDKASLVEELVVMCGAQVQYVVKIVVNIAASELGLGLHMASLGSRCAANEASFH